MEQKTLLSFFKPPKASNTVASSAKNAKQAEGSNLSTATVSPKKRSGRKHSKKAKPVMDSNENVEQMKQHPNRASSSPTGTSKLNSVDSETIEINIPDKSVNDNVQTQVIPRRPTAPKGSFKLTPEILASIRRRHNKPHGLKTGTGESLTKLEALVNKSSDVAMKKLDRPTKSEKKISANGGSVKENSEAIENIQEENAKTEHLSKVGEDKDNGVTSSKSPPNEKKNSKKRRKNEVKSPKDSGASKKQRKTAKELVESDGKEQNSEKKGSRVSDKSVDRAKNDIESSCSTSEEKASKCKMEKTLIHSFFARAGARTSSSSDDCPVQEESKASDLTVDEPLKKLETSQNGSSDVEMCELEDEDSEMVAATQEENQKSKKARKKSPKQKNTKAVTSNKRAGKSPKNQKNDCNKQENRDEEEILKDVPKKQSRTRRAKRIIESDDDEEECSTKKEPDSCENEVTDARVGEKSKTPSPEKKEKTQMHGFFAPKNKTEKNEKLDSSSKESKTSRSEVGPIYDPTKSRYHPVDDACWKKGEKVPYLALARTMEEIENISKRLKIIEILANYFRSVIVLSPDDLLHSVYLCVNRIAPEYEGIEMGIGETLLMKAVAQATGRTLDKIKAEAAVKGDLGLVAESSRGNQRYMFAPPKLTVASVFAKFKEIALMSGNAAMSKKVDKIQALFVACRQCEARYIIRSLSGKLRIGLAEQSVLAALAQAAVLTPPNQSYPPEILNSSSNMSSESFKKKLDLQALILKTTYCECPNYDKIIPVLLKEGIEELPNHCYLSPGVPLKPMLAHPTKGIDEVLRRFDGADFTCEFKYDGERAQIHVMENGEVKIYSRNQEDNTTKYPDVISRISKALKSSTKSCVLDTEAVAWDRDAKQILPFQQLSTRKRKDVVESEIKVQVCVVAFDLIFLNGKSLVKLPLKERRALLLESFVEVENEFMFVHSTDGNTAEVMQEFLEESIKGNCEGLMVKSLEIDASYEIAKRSHNWLKLKKDYLEGVGDTLDLVVIGGYHGKGKRTGAYGGFLLACYDDENEEFQSICKIGTGFKEEEFESHTSFLKEHVISEPKSYFRFDSSLVPDVWFEPMQVWEVKCADLSKSPVHKAAVGIVDPEKGISLRFPRFLRIRDDKKPEDATTASQVAHLYNSQEQIQNQKSKDSKFDEEDFY